MPRIEITPEENYSHWQNHWRKGHPGPTMDICHLCIKNFPLGPVPDFLHKRFGKKAKIIKINCEHPAYEEMNYDCVHCWTILTSKDN